MKRSICIIAIVAIFSFLSHPNSSLVAQNKVDKQGKRQGHWIKTDKDGSRIFEGDFKDGLEVGTFNYYYPNGTLKIRNTYTIPGRFCHHEAYNEKGQKIATGYYNQKNRDSVWHIYNEEGRLVKIASYKMGVKQGAHVIFNASGDTAEVSNWNDNHRHGRWWKRIGSKGYITGTYVNGLMQGKLTEYGEDGKLLRQGNYKNGMKDGKYCYYEGGKMTVEENWQNGALSERKILLHCPSERWVSVFSMAYFMPKGSNGTTVYQNDGTKLQCTEGLDIVNQRAGQETFVLIDTKSRVMASTGSIMGITKDADGRAILELQPKAPFTIFPDEDCIRLVQSLKRSDQLDN